MNNVANAHLIPTAFEVLPNGTVLELARKGPTGEVGFLARHEELYRVVDCVECGDKTYIPVVEHPTVFAALRLPTSAASYGSTRELFDEIRKLLAQYSDLPEASLSKITYFIFGTWLVDRVTIAPFLSIVAAPTAPARPLLELLGLLCRHSLLLTAENPAGLWTLPTHLRPTLLLDAAEVTVSVQRFLRASNSQGIHFCRKGRALDLYCAKAVCSPEPLRDPALAVSALQVALRPAVRELPVLSEEASHRVAEEFQAKFLMYRATKYSNIRSPALDVTDLTTSTQYLARNLGACVADDSNLQADLVTLLHEQDHELQGQRNGGWESLILEALLACCHEPGRSSLRSADVAEIANAILRSHGETLCISSEMVGHRLKALRFRTEAIGSSGRGLWLVPETRATIHRLAQEYGVQQYSEGCAHC